MAYIEIPPMIPLAELKKANTQEQVAEKKVKEAAKPVQSKEKKIQKQTVKTSTQYQLKGISGTYKDAIFPLDEEIIMGRDFHCAAIVFGDSAAGISRAHCKLHANEKGQVYLTDLGSSNGTFLADGTRLKANVPYGIKSGEYFYLVNKTEMFCIMKK